MNQYVHIASGCGRFLIERPMHVFDKIDGSNLRFEYKQKRGWFRQGTRNRLFDHTDLVFGEALEIFHSTLAQPIEQIAKKQRWESLIVFCEFYGENSFAGNHVPGEEKHLAVLDFNPYKKGILGPREYLSLSEGLERPNYLGFMQWNSDLTRNVYMGKLPGVNFEGVVGKAGEGHKVVMAKAKSLAWLEKVRAIHGEGSALYKEASLEAESEGLEPSL